MLNRFQKRIVSLLALAALVFAQMAVSAHACPMLVEQMQIEASSSDMCSPNPALCQAHCQDTQQNVGDHVAPADLIQFVAIFSIASPPLAPPLLQTLLQVRFLVAPGTPPPRLAFSRLLV